jgi:bifunctional UDP-N-acetylglucosamine pyrophosphorylase / glucosamine-1-phosphate N-acetyltransferase
MPAPLHVVILAAGEGKRMRSALPKVLQKIAGRPMLAHVIDTARALHPAGIHVVHGHGGDAVQAAFHDQPDLQWAEQAQQLGTGHAVQQAVPALHDDGVTLILNGDVPLIQSGTLQALLDRCDGQRVVLLSVDAADPTGYGRIIRSGNAVWGVVEHKDCTEEQRAINEVYTGFMAMPTPWLKRWLGKLTNKNAQGEYYLTDVVTMAVKDGADVVAVKAVDQLQVDGVNSALQLAALERTFQSRQAKSLMEQGVRLADPERFDLRGKLTCGTDVEIDINCIFEGHVWLGDNVTIGANCCISNARIAAGAVIAPYTHIEGERAGAQVGENARVGPFARLRPGANLGPEVHVGNFVEIKNTTMGAGSKANHLAYLGDSIVGERVNYGAGSITANYDGANKHRTVIEADVHVGSNAVLVAPVRIGAGGTVGAGSVITKDTAPGVLSVARGKQVVVENLTRPSKN